jgi:hypothetical protein
MFIGIRMCVYMCIHIYVYSFKMSYDMKACKLGLPPISLAGEELFKFVHLFIRIDVFKPIYTYLYICKYVYL